MPKNNINNETPMEKLMTLAGDSLLNYLAAAAREQSLNNADTLFGQKEEEITPTFNLLGPTLEQRKKYLQIALNNGLIEAREIISQLPQSEKILIEVGTPMIKIYGLRAIREIKMLSPESYIVADAKVADLAEREVALLAGAGANAATCLGVAPLETIEEFINACENYKIDSMLDMMNVESSIAVLKKLKKLPSVVILHRGVDETEFSKEKVIPYYQIKQIKGRFNLMVSVAGGDTPLEIQSAFFNDADIVVVWKNFMQADESIGQLADSFLKEIR